MALANRLRTPSGTPWQRHACILATSIFLLLVVGHGIHDAFHDADAGASVCVALTLGLAGACLVRKAQDVAYVLVLRILLPRQDVEPRRLSFDTRGSPPIQLSSLSPLRL